MNRDKLKRWVINVFRFALVAAIFIYLYKSDQFEPAKLRKAFERFDLFGAALLLFLLGAFLGAQRWRYLLYIQDVSIGFWRAFKLTFIGFFFSTAIPGSVSGDVVKAYYIAKGQQQKTALVMSVIFDRLLGLYTMVLVAFLAYLAGIIPDFLAGRESVWSQPYLKALGGFIVFLFLFLTLMIVIAMNRRLMKNKVIERMLQKMPFHETTAKIYNAVNHYCRKPGKTVKAVLLSIIAQIPLYFGMWILAVLLDIKALTVLDYLTVLPVCFLINSIPLAPGGLGVGEAGFRAVFLLFGSQEGAELSLLFHAIFFISAIGIGGIVYLFHTWEQ